MKRLPLVASILLALPQVVGAQVQDTSSEGQATAEQTAQAPGTDDRARPEAIEAADIASRAEGVNERLREAAKLAEPVETTGDIAEQLAGTAEQITGHSRDLAARPPVSLRGVSSSRQHWTSINDLLGGWQEDLQKRSTALQDALDELDAMQATWQATRSSDLPQPAIEQTDSVLSVIATTKAAVDERMEAVLTVQREVSTQREATEKALGRLEDIESDRRSNLLALDQEPVWRAVAADWPELHNDLATTRTAFESSLGKFVEQYKGHAAVHGLLFVALIVLIRLARSAITAKAISDTEVRWASIVLTRPYSAALLLSLLLLWFIYPIASAEIMQFARIVALVPLLRLLPQLVPKLRGLLVFLAVVFVVQAASQVAVEGSLLQLLVLLGATVLAIAALGAGLTQIRRKRLLEGVTIRRVVLALGWLAVVGLIVSLAANILGARTLASLLATAVFNGIWAAVLLRVAINMLSAVLILVLRSPITQALQSVRDGSETIHRWTLGALSLGGLLLWLVLVLDWLQVWQPIANWFRSAIEHDWAVGTLQISVAGIAAFVITIVVAVLVSRVFRFFLEHDVLSKLSLPRGAPATISTLVHYTIVGLGTMLAFAASGMDIGKLGFIVGALGVGIGFGLQNIVNNFVSGLILIFERPVAVGDRISIGTNTGCMTRIGARSSTVKLFDGAEVIVPNANLISSEVTNWSLSDEKRRAEVLLPVPFGSDPRRVVEILQRVADGQEHVLDDPAPDVAFETFDQHAMVFAVRVWPSADANRIALNIGLVADAVAALREAGIDVPGPQRELPVRLDRDQAGAADAGEPE